jgi:hypothetical protein
MARKLSKAEQAEHQREQKLVDDWKYPIGTAVIVRKDRGEEVHTSTRSMPWMVCGVAVIKLEGFSGGYALERVRRAPIGDAQGEP